MICKNCSQPLPENAVFCPNCGTPVRTAQSNDPFSAFTNTEDMTSGYDENDIRTNKGMAILSYLGLLFLIPLFAAKNSPFVRFHLNQGIVLFLCHLAFTICYKILSLLLSRILFFTPFWIISLLVNILYVVFLVFGIVNAYQGKAKKLPLIGEIKIL